MVSGTNTVVDSQVGEKPLFSVGEAVYTWNDVVERAQASGVWAALEDDLRAGIGALRQLEQRGEAPPDRLDEEFAAFCRAAATDAAIEREIESNQLHWIRLRYDAVTFADEDTAGEAALCVRADGDSLGEVAIRVGLELEERYDWI